MEDKRPVNIITVTVLTTRQRQLWNTSQQQKTHARFHCQEDEKAWLNKDLSRRMFLIFANRLWIHQ
jgi:hypothetical protein